MIRDIRIWRLEFVCNLLLGIWNLTRDLEFVISNHVRFSGEAGDKEYRGLFPGGQDKCQVIVREGGDFLFNGEV